MESSDLLNRRDELMAEINSRIKSPRRPDLSLETWRLWEKVGAINRGLRRLAAESENSRQEHMEKLRKGKEAMAARCERVGMALAQEAGVMTWEYRRSLTGRAWVGQRRIIAPKPTTRRRLYVWAHECAHI